MASLRSHTTCAVALCNSPKGPEIVYHKFPKDPKLREKWIRACLRKDPFTASKSSICSLHFLLEDYVRDLKNELLGLPIVRKLKEGAIPSQNLGLKLLSDTRLLEIQLEEAKVRENQKNIIGELLSSNSYSSQSLSFHALFQPTSRLKKDQCGFSLTTAGTMARQRSKVKTVKCNFEDNERNKAVQVDVRNSCAYKRIRQKNKILEEKVEKQRATIRKLNKKIEFLKKESQNRVMHQRSSMSTEMEQRDEDPSFVNVLIPQTNEITIVHLGEEAPSKKTLKFRPDSFTDYRELANADTFSIS